MEDHKIVETKFSGLKNAQLSLSFCFTGKIFYFVGKIDLQVSFCFEEKLRSLRPICNYSISVESRQLASSILRSANHTLTT